MYSTKQYVVSFLLLLCTAISIWLVLKLPAPPPLTSTQPDANNSYMTDVIITRMNAESGKPQDQLESSFMVHSSLDGKTTITRPHFIIFQTVGEPWHLYGDNGQTQNGVDILNLWGHVTLTQPPGPQNQTMTITTSAVTIFPKMKYAETTQPVTGLQPGNVLQAIGMHTDFKTGIVNLLSHVQGKSQGQGIQK